MWKLDQKNITLRKIWRFYGFVDLMSIRVTKDQGNMWLFLNALTLEKLEIWRWCINTNHKMNARSKGIWNNNRTTPQQMGHWCRLWCLFIHEACQEFKGCLRFKDFLQLMRLILDFQVTQCWTKKVVWIMSTLIYIYIDTPRPPRRCFFDKLRTSWILHVVWLKA